MSDYCKLVQTVQQAAIVNNTATLVTFPNVADEVYLTNAGMHSVTTNPGRITIVTAGIYDVGSAMTITGGIAGVRSLYLDWFKAAGGSTTFERTSYVNVSQSMPLEIGFDFKVAVGDYFQMRVKHQSGPTSTLMDAMLFASRVGGS